MDKAYWTSRRHRAVALAGGAASSQAREIHRELARRYGVEADRCDQPPAGPAAGAATGQISIPPRPGSLYRPLREEGSVGAERKFEMSSNSRRKNMARHDDLERPDRDPAMVGQGEASAVDPEAAVMARNGITRIPADHYHVDGYRYTNLADALAQVTRAAPGRRSVR